MKKILHNNKILLYGISAALGFSLMNLFVKQVSYIPFQELVLFRSLITGLLIILTFIYNKNIHIIWGHKSNRKLLFLRGLLGYLALSCYFYSLNLLYLGTATVIQYMSPLFTGLLAIFILKDRIDYRLIICLLVSLLGISLIANLSVLTELQGVLICILSAILASSAYIIVKVLANNKEHKDVIIWYFSFVSIIGSLIFSGFDYILPVKSIDWLFIIGIGLTSYLGQWGITSALQAGQAGYAINLLYLTPVFAIVWGALFLNESIYFNLILGSILIIGTQIYLKHIQQHNK